MQVLGVPLDAPVGLQLTMGPNNGYITHVVVVVAIQYAVGLVVVARNDTGLIGLTDVLGQLLVNLLIGTVGTDLQL